MTQKLAESVKDLAKPTIEALKRVAERDCPECKGIRSVVAYIEDSEGKQSQIVDCPTCNGTGKVRWKWEPEVGECILRFTRHPKDDVGNLGIITQAINRTRARSPVIEFTPIDTFHKPVTENPRNVIPILPWEEIEGVLKEVGYDLHIKDFWEDIERTEKFYTCHISKGYKNGMLNVLAGGEHETGEESKSRQEVVMRAVIELGEELK